MSPREGEGAAIARKIDVEVNRDRIPILEYEFLRKKFNGMPKKPD
jgi:hypothetical protein